MPECKIVRAGPACTLQDAGRFGLLRYGVTPAGPMDWLAHREANVLAGNDPGSVAIEIGPGGLDLEVNGGAIRIGVSAFGFEVVRDARAISPLAAITLMPNERLTVRPGRSHVWAYLSVTGGLALEPVMDSLSTHLRSGIGPLDGKALATGTILPAHRMGRSIDLPDVECISEARAVGGHIRFVPGPQEDYFTAEAFNVFSDAAYKVSAKSDRMGYRLVGPALQHTKGHDIVSDGIAMGAIQVPGDGQPIVLMADRQPTGGYPKIGTVIRADIPKLAQARAQHSVRLEPVSINEAVAALRAAMTPLDDIIAGCRPMRQGIDVERLASGDFAGAELSMP